MGVRGAVRARLGDLRSVVAIRPFAIYQTGAVAMTMGFWMQRVAVGWLMWRMTGSETWLGLTAFAELFPAIATGLIGGTLADRSGAPRVLMAGNLVLSALSAVMFALGIAGLLTPWVLLAMMATIGSVAGLIVPSRLAMASWLAPRALLPAALAVNSTAFNLSRFLGPALAGALIVVMPAEWVFVIGATGYATLAASLWRIRAVPPVIVPPPRPAGDNGGAWAVIRKMPQMPVVTGVILIQFALGTLVRPAAELFPAFAEVAFGRGAGALGLLNAALGVGSILGALALARPRPPAAALRLILVSAVVFCLTLPAFAAAPGFALALALLVVHGVAMSGANIAALAFVQIHSPPERLGRILSLYAIVFRSGPALGAFVFGLLAERAGLASAAGLFGAIGLVAVLGLGAFVRRRYRAGGLAL